MLLCSCMCVCKGAGGGRSCGEGVMVGGCLFVYLLLSLFRHLLCPVIIAVIVIGLYVFVMGNVNILSIQSSPSLLCPCPHHL